MISFLVACYNEQNNIIATIKEIEKTCEELKINFFEIIVIDDCSKDNSNNLVKEYKENNNHIKLLTNEYNLGYGGSIKKAAQYSNMEYIIWVPGDNAHKKEELIKILNYINDYEIISTYYTNTEKRNKYRRIFTETYTPLLNLIFGLKLPYYNGVTIIKKSIFQNLNILTNSHNFSVEMWVKIKLFYNPKIKFVPTLLDERLKGANTFKLKNSIKVLSNTIRLIFYFYWVIFLKYLKFKKK